MNQAFFHLPEQKQRRILLAALEVFSRSEYKHASTADIAEKAGVSKGLLFHYFQNKRSLYLYLIQFAEDLVRQNAEAQDLYGITDFFELLERSAQMKTALFSDWPYILEFVTRAYYSAGETVSQDMEQVTRRIVDQMPSYMQQVDLSKFRPEVELSELFSTVLYLTDGYIHLQQIYGRPVDLADLKAHYQIWLAGLKKLAYREEFL